MDAKEKIRAGLAELWEKHLPEMRARVAILQRAAEAIRAGELTSELRREAMHEAHKLAGALGTFGHREGSEAAQVLERALDGDGEIEPMWFQERIEAVIFPILGNR